MYSQIHIRPAGFASFHSLLMFLMLLFANPFALLSENAVASQTEWLACQKKLKKAAIFEVFSKYVVIY